MNFSPQVQLKTSSILNIPLQCYDNIFTFIVNGQEFKTNRLIADLLSTKVCHLHLSDPTIDTYLINTEEKGDFSSFLKLVNFERNDIKESDIPFFIEIIQKLDSESINIIDQEETPEITIDNVVSRLLKHERYSAYYSKSFNDEIEFISSHFYEIDSTRKEEMKNLKIETLYSIFSNEHLKLDDEDQLFEIINELYSKDAQYSILYGTINFLNASEETISEFIKIFDENDLTHEIWQKICHRLNQKVTICEDENRYKLKKFTFSEDKPFLGIIDYLRTKSKNQLKNEIAVTSSSYYNNIETYLPENVFLFDDQSKGFASSVGKDSWICIDFKEHRVIPTDYTIRSIGPYFTSYHFLKSWVIETSNDNAAWKVIDDVKNDTHLKGNLLVHTFKITQPSAEKVRYIRMRMTDTDWGNCNYLTLDSIEIFGTIF